MTAGGELMDKISSASPDRPWVAFYPPGVAADVPEPPYQLIGDIARDVAAKHADKPAFRMILPNGMAGTLSFRDVDRQSDAFAAFLRENLHLARGDRVAVQTPNVLAYPIAALGILKAGCILVNINPLYTAGEIAAVLKDAEPAAVVAIDLFADKLGTALKSARVPNVILTRASDFLPFLQKTLVAAVQRHVRREVPTPDFPFVTFAKALSIGAAATVRQVEAYTAGLDSSTTACLQYTGGTTGGSKGAMLTHRNLIMNMAQFQPMITTESTTQDAILTVLPLYHIYAFTVNFLAFFAKGNRNVLIPNPRPLTNLRKAFEQEAITFITGVNTLFNGLANEAWFRDAPPKSLRRTSAGGAALQMAVAERWEKVTGCAVSEGYGLTEASPVVTSNPLERTKPGTVGIPLPSTLVRLVGEDGRDCPAGEPGQLAVKGPQVMAGYWRRPDETAKVLRDGWLLTGDVATIDAEGYVTIVDRLKDMVIVSGFNVYPNEVEAVLATMPGIVESAVIGVPDAATGEAVKAFVVRSDPALEPDAVRAYCKVHLSGYKVPKLVEFRTDLPKSNVGKILRKDLRSEATRAP